MDDMPLVAVQNHAVQNSMQQTTRHDDQLQLTTRDTKRNLNRRRRQSESGNVIRNQIRRTSTISYFKNKKYTQVTPIRNYKLIMQTQVKKLLIILCFIKRQQHRLQHNDRIDYIRPQNRGLLPLYPDDLIVQIWKYLIYVMMFLSTLLYPYYICFEDVQIWDPIVLVLSIVFAIDIILNMMTAYVDDNSNLRITYTDIQCNYAQTWLLFDIVSALPYSLITNDKQYYMFKLFRVLKYFTTKRLRSYKGQIFDKIRDESLIPDESISFTEGTQFLMTVLMNALLLVHIFGCFQHYLMGESYMSNIYWASQTVTMVGYGDQAMNNTLTSIWLLVGVGYYSLTIGNLAKLLSHYNIVSDKDDLTFQIEQLAYYTDIPDKLKSDVLSFTYTNIKDNAFWLTSSKRMLNELPFSLYRRMVMSAMLQITMAIPFYLLDVNNTVKLLANSRFYIAEANRVLYRQGQSANEIFYLISGDVRIMTQRKFVLLNILQGTIFGELEALDECNRITYAQTMSQSLLLVIPAKQLKDKIKQSVALDFELRQLYMRRKQLIIQGLRKERLNKKALRRSMVHVFTDSLLHQTKEQHHIVQQSKLHQDMYHYNHLFLQKILGQKRLKIEQFLVKFRRSVNRLIDFNRQLEYTPAEDWKELNDYRLIKRIIPYKLLENRSFQMSVTRRSSILSAPDNKRVFSQMMQNYTNTRQQEIKVQRILKLYLKNTRERYEKVTLRNTYLRYLDDPDFINEKTKINLIQSKYVEKQVTQQQQCDVDIVQVRHRTEVILDRMSVISRLWTRGSMRKFELYKLLNDNIT